MSGILSERVLGAVLGTVVGLSAFGAANTASAQSNEAQACSMVLFELEEARDTLDELQDVVDTAKANRGTLRNGADELAAQIHEAASAAQAKALEADRKEVLDEIALINRLLPPIEAQTKALATQVSEAEQTYLACTEAHLP